MKTYDNGRMAAQELTEEELNIYYETMQRLGNNGAGEGFGKAVAALAKEIQDYRQKIASLMEVLDMRNDDIVELREENRKMMARLQEAEAEKIHPKVETKTEDGITVITIRTAQAIDNVDVYFRGEGDR